MLERSQERFQKFNLYFFSQEKGIKRDSIYKKKLDIFRRRKGFLSNDAEISFLNYFKIIPKLLRLFACRYCTKMRIFIVDVSCKVICIHFCTTFQLKK